MLKPFYKIQDQRSLFKRIYHKCYSRLTGIHTNNIPDYQICKRYVSDITKGICTVLVLSVCGVFGTAVYQTIYPNYSTMIVTIDATSTLASITDYAPTYHGFPLKVNTTSDNENTLDYNAIHQKQNFKKQMLCLAKNIYFEARSEGIQGQLAVGLVTLNRVIHDDFPDNVCDVVWQNKQFSWTHDGLSDIPAPGKTWLFSKKMADFLLTVDTFNHIEDVTGEATFYHANYVSPYWRESYSKTVEVGLHQFYKHNNL